MIWSGRKKKKNMPSWDGIEIAKNDLAWQRMWCFSRFIHFNTFPVCIRPTHSSYVFEQFRAHRSNPKISSPGPKYESQTQTQIRMWHWQDNLWSSVSIRRAHRVAIGIRVPFRTSSHLFISVVKSKSHWIMPMAICQIRYVWKFILIKMRCTSVPKWYLPD